MASRHGLSELYTPPEGTKVTAHIVFVHGLFGHPQKTWTAKNSDDDDLSVFWPKSLLPVVIPDAKVFSFGYDADVDGFLSSAGQNTMHQHAQNLLSDLADLRPSPNEQSIPLIFVVHSLGGIVVKDALNQSASTVGTRLKTIAPSTFGICFLGTPHRGSRSASMGRIAYNFTVMFTKRPNLRLLQGLERHSETLDRVGSAFSQTLLKHKIAVYSFREEKETRKYGIFHTIVVNADSAKIGDGREEVGSIPADHSNMTKFESSADAGFRRVSAQLRRWLEALRVDDVTLAQDRTDCLDSLSNADTGRRIVDVREAHDKTFHWLFDPNAVSFSKWLGGKSPNTPIYWIQGKPGSGKSTLMKFAMRSDRLQELLDSGSQHRWILAAFFFHDRGAEIQKSLAGMFQELLGSILRQVPSLAHWVVPFYDRLVKAQRTRKPIWDIDALETAMLSIMKQRKVKIRIFLLLDALDEHHGDNDRLASLLKKLVDSTDKNCVRLKLCLASRSWTVFEQNFGKCPGFAIHDHTQQDIRTYIKIRLGTDDDAAPSTSASAGLQRIINLIAEKALGVFIWVRLVVDLLSKGIRDGTPYAALEEKVASMPQELKDLYADTLRRIEVEYSSEAYIMLHLVLCSDFPLPVQNLMASIDQVQHTYWSSRPPQSDAVNNPLENDVLLASHKSRLASRTGGLLELSSATTPSSETDTQDLIVQFIHQTVKEYVESSPRGLGLPSVSPPILADGGHMFLLRSCTAHGPWAHNLKENVFLYAARALMDSQSKEDDTNFSTVKRDIIATLVEEALPSIGAYNLETHLSNRPGTFFDALREEVKGGYYTIAMAKLAVAMGFPEYVNEGQAITIPGLLHIAACGGLFGQNSEEGNRRGAISYLISNGCPVDARHYDSPLQHTQTLPVLLPYGITALQVALLVTNIAQETRLNIVEQLLKSGANPSVLIPSSVSSGIPQNNALAIGVIHHSAAIVRLLLQYATDLDSNLVTVGSNLDIRYLACIRGDRAIMQALLDYGISGASLRDISDEASGPPRLSDGLLPSAALLISIARMFS